MAWRRWSRSPTPSGACSSRCAARSPKAIPWARPATNKQIAAELFLTVQAVKTHLRALFGRFGLEDLGQNEKRLRLAELALQAGLVTAADLQGQPNQPLGA